MFILTCMLGCLIGAPWWYWLTWILLFIVKVFGKEN